MRELCPPPLLVEEIGGSATIIVLFYSVVVNLEWHGALLVSAAPKSAVCIVESAAFTTVSLLLS